MSKLQEIYNKKIFCLKTDLETRKEIMRNCILHTDYTALVSLNAHDVAIIKYLAVQEEYRSVREIANSVFRCNEAVVLRLNKMERVGYAISIPNLGTTKLWKINPEIVG